MSEKTNVDSEEFPMTAYEKRQVLGEVTLNETFSLTTENAATILALLGRAKKEQKSPTATVMLEGLHRNFSIIFDRMMSSESQMAYLKIARTVSDDKIFEYGKIVKDGKMTKMLALASFLNFLQQEGVHDHVELVDSGESDRHFEFVAVVMKA